MNIKYEIEDRSVLLKTVEAGKCFYFSGISENDAVNENAVYMVVSGGKDSRVQIVNLYDGLLMQRDDCHNVVKIKLNMVLPISN